MSTANKVVFDSKLDPNGSNASLLWLGFIYNGGKAMPDSSLFFAWFCSFLWNAVRSVENTRVDNSCAFVLLSWMLLIHSAVWNMLLFNCDVTFLQILECEFYLLELMVGEVFCFNCHLSLLFMYLKCFEFCAMEYVLCCRFFFYFTPILEWCSCRSSMYIFSSMP